MRLMDKMLGRRMIQLTSTTYGTDPVPWGGVMMGPDGSEVERVSGDFESYARDGYGANSVVFALNYARLRYFAQARFKFRALSDKRLFGTPDLAILEQPWPNGTTAELLARMIQDADLGGNSFWVRSQERVWHLRPDWVSIAIADVMDPATGAEWDEVAGYVYREGGMMCADADVVYLPVEAVVHWSPIPDPLALYRGMSWIAPSVREVNNDNAMGALQDSFFRNGATPNTVIKYAQKLPKGGVERVRELWNARHGGTNNAFKTAVMDDGADFQVIGSDFTQMAYEALRAQGETRLASAAGVPPIVAGLQSGLDSATYSNYGMAMRSFADGTLRHLWQSACVALSKLVNVPAGAELWYDTSDIAALRESETDRAVASQTLANAASELIRAGFDPDTVFPALLANDYSLLKHTGGVPTALYPNGVAPGAPGANDTSAT